MSQIAVLALPLCVIGGWALVGVLDSPPVTPWPAWRVAALAMCLALAAGPFAVLGLRWLAVIDAPNHRSSHAVPTPRGGGFVLVLVVSAVLLVGVVGDPPVLLAVCAAMGCLGFAEDLYPMPAALRLVLQIAAALLLVPVLLRDWHAAPLTMIGASLLAVLWLVGFVNAFNFMDGINGISAMQVVVAGAGWWILAHNSGEPALAAVAAVLVGAALGFLPFNFPHARMFLGDVGSYFLGAALAAFAVAAIRQGLDPLAVAAPLGVFVIDPLLTFLRRWRAGDQVLEAHRSHTYQLLCRSGWSHVQTTGLVVAINVVLMAVALMTLGWSVASRGLVVVSAAAVLGAYMMLPALLARHGSVLEPVLARTPRPVLTAVGYRQAGHRWLVSSAPMLFVVDAMAWAAGCFTALLVLRGAGAGGTVNDLLDVAPQILGSQLIMGASVGIYRWRWRVGSFSELGGVATVLALDVVFGSALLLGQGGTALADSFVFVSALIAGPLMLVPRAVWRGIRDRRAPASVSGRRVLVYGAGRGAALLIPMLTDSLSTLYPVGLIDDDPAKRFRSLHGVRVVGTGDDLFEVARRLQVDSVVIGVPSADERLTAMLVQRIEACGLTAIVSLSVGTNYRPAVAESGVQLTTIF